MPATIKLHIVEHYIAVLLLSKSTSDQFKVFAVGNVGDDAAGATLISEMADVGIDTRYVRIEFERTTLFSFAFFSIQINRAEISPYRIPRRAN